MDKVDVKVINSLEDICRDMSALMQPLDQIIRRAVHGPEAMEQLTEKIADIATQAEENGDLELMKFICSNILPQMDGVYQLYEQLEQIKRNLKKNETLVNLLKPNCICHIAADTVGNVGDYILVRSFRKLVERKNSDISWCPIYIRDEVDEEYLSVCNQSKGILLGGGGFFLRDTNPNELSGWQWAISVEDLKKIKVPIYVMGVGYNRFREQEEFAECFIENINQLVEQSAFFGLRNHGSIEAIRGYLREELKEKVTYHPCATTVLSKLYQLPERSAKKPYIALNCAFDRAGLRYQDKMDDVMYSIARVAKELAEDYEIHCYMHCPADEMICNYLDRLEVPYEKIFLWAELEVKVLTALEYLRYYTEPELVLAVRGHAQMIPFGCKTPAVSMISHDKLKWFLEDIGHPEWGIEVLDEDFEAKLLEKSRYMLSHREEICQQIEIAQERLWRIMQENLSSLDI